jgi:colanic acid/amylovoran biosynthesis glycosyltransferase
VGRVRLALVVNKYPSLSETFIQGKAVGLHQAGIDVTIIAATPPTDDPGLFANTAPRFDGPVRSMMVSRDVGRSMRQLAARALRPSGHELGMWTAAVRRYGMTRRAVRAWLIAIPLSGFDILHLEYSGLAVAYLDALALLDGSRLVVSCRGTAERMTPRVQPERARQLTKVFAVVDRVHCVSHDMLETCESYGLARDRAFVNWPAVDTQRFRRTAPFVPRTSGTFTLLSTGRLHWAKGLEYGLQAVRHLVDAGHDVHYIIIGGGAEEGRIRFAIHDLGLARHVTLAGRASADEVRTALEAADVYLLPSISEGISNAALEAMAMQVPVVSTAAGGMREAITHGVEGLVVPTRNPQAMADAVASLLQAPEQRIAFGNAARARVERDFTIERQIQTFVQEYRALARHAPRATRER